MKQNNIHNELVERIKQAFNSDTPVYLSAGGSKSFYGETCNAEKLDISGHAGITEYDPRELVITARSGTTLSEIENSLAENRQMLAFEPPRYAATATLGGAIATGLSGPRRPWAGSVRDYVLGVGTINGRGEQLQFGGQVMKNVAGYDVSRLMCGALGTLGLVTDISLKVLPLPAMEVTHQHECNVDEFLEICAQLATSPAPVSAICHIDGLMHVRLSGSMQSVNAASDKLKGDSMEHSAAKLFWQQLRDHEMEFFDTDKPLWRLSLPADTLPLQLDGETLYDWGGAQRWVKTDEPAEVIRSLCDNHNGHAILFRNNPGNIDTFHPLEKGLAVIHKNLKKAFDPACILNPGRMYSDL